MSLAHAWLQLPTGYPPHSRQPHSGDCLLRRQAVGALSRLSQDCRQDPWADRRVLRRPGLRTPPLPVPGGASLLRGSGFPLSRQEQQHQYNPLTRRLKIRGISRPVHNALGRFVSWFSGGLEDLSWGENPRSHPRGSDRWRARPSSLSELLEDFVQARHQDLGNDSACDGGASSSRQSGEGIHP